MAFNFVKKMRIKSSESMEICTKNAKRKNDAMTSLLVRCSSRDNEKPPKFYHINVVSAVNETSVIRVTIINVNDANCTKILRGALKNSKRRIIKRAIPFASQIDEENKEIRLVTGRLQPEDELRRIIHVLVAGGFTLELAATENCTLLQAALPDSGRSQIVAYLRKGETEMILPQRLRPERQLFDAGVATRHWYVELIERVIKNNGISVSWLRSSDRQSIICYYPAEGILQSAVGRIPPASFWRAIGQRSDLIIRYRCKKIVDFVTKRVANFRILEKFGNKRIRCEISDAERIPQRWNFTDKEQRMRLIMLKIAETCLRICGNIPEVTTGCGRIVFHGGVGNGFLRYVEIPMDHGADANSWINGKLSRNPLFAAVRMRNPGITRLLLERRAKVNARGHLGRTALHEACLVRNDEAKSVVVVLLKHGANIRMTDENGMTPLHLAAKSNSPKIGSILLSAGAEIEAKDHCGRTPLHIASTQYVLRFVCLLLEHGADVNVKCNKGNLAHSVYASTFSFYNDDNNDDETRFFYSCPIRQVRHELAKQIVKLRALDAYLVDENLRYVDFHQSYKDFYERCKAESESMKIAKIGDSNINFFDFAAKKIEQLVARARNSCVVDAFNSSEYKEQFPIYHRMICHRFLEARRLAELFDAGIRAFDVLLRPRFHFFPYNEIIGYLNRRDIENLIKAARDPKSFCTKDTKCFEAAL